MDFRGSLDGAAGMLLLALPWLLLAVAAWRATHGKDDSGDRLRTRVSTPTDEPSEPSAETRAAKTQSANANQPSAEPLGIMAASPLKAHQESPGVSVGLDALEAKPFIEEHVSPAETEILLRHGIETAKNDNDHAGLARLSVELAQSLLARSTGPEAAALLQSAVRAARQAKLPLIHAEARIELAGIAIQDGDLTSACEHWQMAKTLFHEIGRRADQDRMADLMRRHRCPTDWVLTNF
jgi:hypothetical protein